MSDEAIFAACPVRSQLDFGEQLEHTWVTCNICCKLKQKAEDAAAAAAEATPSALSEVPAEEKPVKEDPKPIASVLPKSVPAPAGWYDPFSGAKPLPTAPAPTVNRGRGGSRGGRGGAIPICRKNDIAAPSTSNPSPASPAPSNASKPKNDKLSNKARDRLDAQKFRKTNENVDKKKAALQVVQERRAEAQADKNTKAKAAAAVAPSDMAWVPNPHFLLPANSISALQIDDHRRYVAIISNFLHPDANLRFEFNNIELENMDERLKDEREKFIECIHKSFDSKGFYANAFSGSIKFALKRLKTRINALPQCGYSEVVKEISWDPNMTAVKTMYAKKPEVLSKGRSTKVSMPDPTRRCLLESSFDKISQRFDPDAAPKLLQDDNTAISHAVGHEVTAALTASSMRHLLSAPFPLRTYRRAFPMSIQRRFTNGRPERVIIIERPVPVSGLSKVDLVRSYGKYIVRNAIERAPKVDAPVKNYTGVRPLKRKLTDAGADEVNDEKKPKLEESDEPEVKMEESIEPEVNPEPVEEKHISLDDELQIDEDEDDDEEPESEVPAVKQDIADVKEVAPEPVKAEPEPMEAAPATSSTSLLHVLLDSQPSNPSSTTPKQPVDLLDSILGNMDTTEVAAASPTTNSTYSYSVIPIDEKGQHKVLVRSRAHNKNDAGFSFSLSTKLEYIPKCGSEELYEEELIWNAMTAMLRGSEIHGTVHLTLPEAHCLQIRLSKSQKVFDALPVSAKEKLSGRWNRLYHLLDEIKDLNEGDYLLVESDNDTLKVYSEAISESDAVYSREKILEQSGIANHDKIYNESIDFKSKFNGISAHTPLTWHVVKGRIPGSFLPPNPNRPAYQYNGKNERGRGGGRGRGRGRGRGGNFRGRGNQRGRGGRGGRGRGGGGNDTNRQKVAYTDHDANPFRD
uniref:NARG2_C domain-containing protein n=1 Tax=Panagrellus redivivus TaxID=6233 RepID=A0A7E4ZVQ3_PANRE